MIFGQCRLLVCCLVLVAFGEVVVAAPSTQPMEKLPTKGPIEVKWGAAWRTATIVQRDGELYLVKYDNMPQQFHWEWVVASQLRPIGSDRQIDVAIPGETVGIGTVEKAKAALKKRLAEEKRREAGKLPTDERNPKKPDEAAEGFLPKPVAIARVENRTPANVASVAWTYAPPAANARAAKVAAAPVVLSGASGAFFEKLERVLFSSPDARFAAAVHVDAPPGKPAVTRVERCDLRTRKSVGTTMLEGDVLPLALSPDGQSVLVVSRDQSPGSRSLVAVVSLKTGKVDASRTLVPFDGEIGSHTDVSSARYLDESRVLISSYHGRNAVVDVAAMKSLWVVEAGSALLSPTGDCFVGRIGADCVLFQTSDGRAVGRLPGAPFAAAMAFDSAGSRLASIGNSRVTVWELATGNVTHDISLPTGVASNRIRWLRDDFILVGGNYLLDLSSGAVVWRYDLVPGAEHATDAPADAHLWLIGTSPNGKNRVLSSVALPDEPAIKAARAFKPEDYFAITAGAKVSIELNFAAPDDVRASTLNALRATLEKNGLVVADGQPIRLVATTEDKPGQPITYQRIGQGAETVPGTITEMRLSWLIDGAKAWELAGSFRPSAMYTIRQGETIASLIEKDRAAALGFFSRAWVPTKVPKAAPAPAVGSGTVGR